MATITYTFSANTKIKSAESNQNHLDAQGGHTLGYAEADTDGQVINTSMTDISGASITVTVPSGGRQVLLLAQIGMYQGGAQYGVAAIRESTTTLNQIRFLSNNASQTERHACLAVVTPSAGSHTYKLSALWVLAAGNLDSNATYRTFIMAQWV